MKGNKAAGRYAKSLMMLAIEQNVLEQAYADMKRVDDVCDQSRDLQILLKSPVIKSDKKLSILNAIFGKELSPISSGFIRIITQHKRENLLHDIADSFVHQYKVYKKISVVEIITAQPLQADIKSRILDVLRKSQGAQVEVNETVDADIIGGLIVRMDDKQFDGSIQRKLNDLKKQFSKNPYVPNF